MLKNHITAQSAHSSFIISQESKTMGLPPEFAAQMLARVTEMRAASFEEGNYNDDDDNHNVSDEAAAVSYVANSTKNINENSIETDLSNTEMTEGAQSCNEPFSREKRNLVATALTVWAKGVRRAQQESEQHSQMANETIPATETTKDTAGNAPADPQQKQQQQVAVHEDIATTLEWSDEDDDDHNTTAMPETTQNKKARQDQLLSMALVAWAKSMKPSSRNYNDNAEESTHHEDIPEMPEIHHHHHPADETSSLPPLENKQGSFSETANDDKSVGKDDPPVSVEEVMHDSDDNQSDSDPPVENPASDETGSTFDAQGDNNPFVNSINDADNESDDQPSNHDPMAVEDFVTESTASLKTLTVEEADPDENSVAADPIDSPFAENNEAPTLAESTDTPEPSNPTASPDTNQRHESSADFETEPGETENPDAASTVDAVLEPSQPHSKEHETSGKDEKKEAEEQPATALSPSKKRSLASALVGWARSIQESAEADEQEADGVGAVTDAAITGAEVVAGAVDKDDDWEDFGSESAQWATTIQTSNQYDDQPDDGEVASSFDNWSSMVLVGQGDEKRPPLTSAKKKLLASSLIAWAKSVQQSAEADVAKAEADAGDVTAGDVSDTESLNIDNTLELENDKDQQGEKEMANEDGSFSTNSAGRDQNFWNSSFGKLSQGVALLSSSARDLLLSPVTPKKATAEVHLTNVSSLSHSLARGSPSAPFVTLDTGDESDNSTSETGHEGTTETSKQDHRQSEDDKLLVEKRQGLSPSKKKLVASSLVAWARSVQESAEADEAEVHASEHAVEPATAVEDVAAESSTTESRTVVSDMTPEDPHCSGDGIDRASSFLHQQSCPTPGNRDLSVVSDSGTEKNEQHLFLFARQSSSRSVESAANSDATPTVSNTSESVRLSIKKSLKQNLQVSPSLENSASEMGSLRDGPVRTPPRAQEKMSPWDVRHNRSRNVASIDDVDGSEDEVAEYTKTSNPLLCIGVLAGIKSGKGERRARAQRPVSPSSDDAVFSESGMSQQQRNSKSSTENRNPANRRHLFGWLRRSDNSKAGSRASTPSSKDSVLSTQSNVPPSVQANVGLISPDQGISQREKESQPLASNENSRPSAEGVTPELQKLIRLLTDNPNAEVTSSSMKEALQGLENFEKEAELQKNRHEKEISELQKNIQNTLRTSAELKALNRGYGQAQKELSEELLQSQASLAQVRKENVSLQELLEDLSASRVELQKMRERNQSLLSEMESEREQSLGSIETLKEENVVLRKELIQLSKAEQEVKRLRTERDAHLKQVDELQQRIDETQTAPQHNSEHAEESGRTQQLEAETRQLVASLQEELRSNKQLLANKVAELDRLKNEFSESQLGSQESDPENSEAQPDDAALDGQQQRVADLRSKVRKNEKSVLAEVQRVSSVDSEDDNTEKEIKNMEIALQRSNKRVRDLEIQLSRAQNDLKSDAMNKVPRQNNQPILIVQYPGYHPTSGATTDTSELHSAAPLKVGQLLSL